MYTNRLIIHTNCYNDSLVIRHSGDNRLCGEVYFILFCHPETDSINGYREGSVILYLCICGREYYMGMFDKKTIEELEVRGKRVLTRCDFNVPIDEEGNITDDTRIRQRCQP